MNLCFAGKIFSSENVPIKFAVPTYQYRLYFHITTQNPFIVE